MINFLIRFSLHFTGSGQGEKWDKNSIKGPKIGGPFSLYDTQGRIVTERDLMGKWVLLYFGYTSSPDVGPAEVQKMAKAIDTLGTSTLFINLIYSIYVLTMTIHVLIYILF